MGDGISSEEDESFVGVYVFIDPSSPCFKGLSVCLKGFESRVHVISDLVIIFPADSYNSRV